MTEPVSAAAPAVRESKHWQAELGLAFVCLAWGATFVIVKSALSDVSTLLFLGLRFTVATLVLLCIFVFRRGAGGLTRGPIWGGVLAGTCLFSGYALQTEGLKFTTPGKSGFITGLYIVLVPVFSALIHRKMPSVREWVGVLLAMLGMALMALTGDSLHINRGDALTVACAVVYALHILILGWLSPKMSVERLTLLQLGTCALLGLGTFRWLETYYYRPTQGAWIAIGVTAIVATALAFTIQTWAQQFTSPTRTALIFSLEPVFALATSYFAGAENLTPRSVAGAACILAGILVVELKRRS